MAQIESDAAFEHADAITLKQPSLKLVSQPLNDAILIGNQHTPETQAVLASEITIMLANGRRTPGNRWALVTGTVGQLIQGSLSKHPVNVEKDDLAYVYARGAKAGKTTSNGNVTQYGWRVQNKIEAVTAFFADVDGTDKAQRVAELIHKHGWFGLVYTTHSHAAKKTEHGDRFRVIIFLENPFTIPTDDVESRRLAVAEWQSRYAGMCELLGLEEIDSSAMNLHQMMYTPRRASEDAEYEHYITAGRALRIDEMPKGDASKYRKAGPSGPRRETTAMDSGEPAILADGFDLRDWWEDGGRHIMLDTLLDYLGWDTRGVSGDGQHILCPNDAAHSNPGDPDDRGTWAVEGDEGALIYCHHDHCLHLCTWDFIRLLEENIADGVAVLPDGYDSLSALLCEPALFPEIDGEVLDFDPADFGVVEEIKIAYLGTHHKVKRAFKAVAENDRAGDDQYAALYAGVEKAGNKRLAVEKLDALMKEHGVHTHNQRLQLARRGKEMLKEDRAKWAAEKDEERRRQAAEASGRNELAHPSMDIADPLHDCEAPELEPSLATLGNRYALVDIGGKFKALRKPDLAALRERGTRLKSVVVASTIPDFIKYHENRCIVIDDLQVNPAKLFVETQPRKSDVVFAPPPVKAGPNDFNMYYGRTLSPVEGDCADIEDFILNVTCAGRKDLNDWTTLYMAHMVQRPGEKPGTGIVGYGPGGAGKGTFGDIMTELTLPHSKLIEKEDHLIGKFAGEHLSTCIFVHVTEAVFPTGKNSSALKALLTSTTMLVEPKGLSVMDMPSFLRVYFDSNEDLVVPIEGNGSERRYLVMKVSDHRVGDKAYFQKLHRQIKGPEMQAFLHKLMHYVPEDHGFTWDDVREAPATPERNKMAYQC